jgi:nucleotide-binding universal stress UspA family protein
MIAPIKNRLFNILLADDGSLQVHAAIQLLAELPHTSEYQISALRVFTSQETSEYNSIEAETEKTNNLLKSRHFHFKSEIVLGYPAETILAYATEHSPDLIVMGAKGKSMLTNLLGSVATDVVHAGKWPVLIVRQPFKGIKKVLLTTDGSHASHFTCDYLSDFPLPPDVSVEVMHVMPVINPTYLVEPSGLVFPTLLPEDEARIKQENEIIGREALERACYELSLRGHNAKKVLRTGNYVDQILDYAQTNSIDLLVCGSRGIGNLTGWLLGSVSRELVLRAPCSVMVVSNPPRD